TRALAPGHHTDTSACPGTAGRSPPARPRPAHHRAASAPPRRDATPAQDLPPARRTAPRCGLPGPDPAITPPAAPPRAVAVVRGRPVVATIKPPPNGRTSAALGSRGRSGLSVGDP